MNNTMEFFLDGLCCGGCVKKIKNELTQLSEIENVEVDFLSKKLVFKIKDTSQKNLVINNIKEIINKKEPEISFLEIIN